MREGEESQSTTSRGGFLRRLATLAAVGLGVALVPSKARAQSGRCCRNPAECPDSACTDPNFPYNRQCSGCGSGPCCQCTNVDPQTDCFTTACPCP
jgi:hypothetical protein